MSGRTIGPVMINGEAVDESQAAISIFDIGFQRGYGCFEAMRSYEGVVFRQEGHLERLRRSAEHLRIPIDDLGHVAAWCTDVAAGGSGVLRIFITGGTDPTAPGTDGVTVVYLAPLPEINPAVRLDLLPAPWHADGRESELTGAKTLSYGANLAATIRARDRGFDDAALIGSGGDVLEGPTFSLGWVKDGCVFTPSLESHILASITREATLEVAKRCGIDVTIGRFPVARLAEADEVFIMSTVREVTSVVAVGDAEIEPGEVTARLREGFSELVAEETQ